MKKELLDAIIYCVNNNPVIKNKINKKEYLPDTLLTLSSIDFADLLIDIENHLGIQFIEHISLESKITIFELAERIEKFV